MSSQVEETSRVAWRMPIDGLWVAETPDDYLGMVDRSDDGFVATGSTGHDLGVFPTLQAAQLAVYTRWFRADPEPVVEVAAAAALI